VPGQFDARWPGTDQGEGEPALAFGGGGGGLGHLERAEYRAANDQGILDGLHAGRV
jgi:hypothetical protein